MTDPTATTTTSKDFFDTNVLVYAHDPRDLAKQALTQRLLTDAIANDTGVVSAQVLGEFFNAVTRRIPTPLTIEEAEQAVEQFGVLTVIQIDLPLVQRAVATCRRYQISYWDALIIAAAERAGCTRLISEDLNPDQTYNGVTVINPFLARNSFR